MSGYVIRTRGEDLGLIYVGYESWNVAGLLGAYDHGCWHVFSSIPQAEWALADFLAHQKTKPLGQLTASAWAAALQIVPVSP